MPLTVQEQGGVRRAITDLLENHLANPFHVLRERGAVAELRQRLLLSDALNRSVTANVNRHKPWAAHKSDLPIQFSADVLRIQLEISVLSARAPVGRSAIPGKDIDIGILTGAPELRVASNGPGDVLQQVKPQSLAAAIEVKACPTVDYVQRGHCVGDLQALLRLKREFHIDGFFVLLDKSHVHYGSWIGRSDRDQPIIWESDVEQSIRRKLKVGKTKVHRTLRGAGVEIWDQPPPAGLTCVELWTLSAIGGEWRPVCRYVSEAAASPAR
jgi:hypothetical protein